MVVIGQFALALWIGAFALLSDKVVYWCGVLARNLSSHTDMQTHADFIVTFDLWPFDNKDNSCRARYCHRVPSLVLISQVVFLLQRLHAHRRTIQTHKTQPCIPLGSLNRVGLPALIGWGKGENATYAECAIPHGTWVPVAVRLIVANCSTPSILYIHVLYKSQMPLLVLPITHRLPVLIIISAVARDEETAARQQIIAHLHARWVVLLSLCPSQDCH